MKFYFLLFLLFPIVFFAQKQETINNAKEKASLEFNKKTNSGGTGVLGTKNRNAYAIFIDEKSPTNNPEIFYKVSFETMNFNDKKSSVYLCIYENNNGLPGKIIDKAKIFIEIPTKLTEIIADLSSLNIQVPTNGYFVGFEWILSKENEIKGVTKTSNPPYNPTIDGIISGETNLFVHEKKWQKASVEFNTSLKLDISILSSSK